MTGEYRYPCSMCSEKISTTLPETESDIDSFLAGFESCTLPKARWTHGAHILTGACYVHAFGRETALTHLRNNIRRYNESVGGKNTETEGYHESITVFWVRILAQMHAAGTHTSGAWPSRSAFAHAAVARFAPQRDLFKSYYSFDLIGSIHARREWVPPDLQPLD